MNNLEEDYQKIPEFFSREATETTDENSETEEVLEYNYKTKRLSNLDENEKSFLYNQIKIPSKLIVEQSYAPVNFETYSGFLSKDFSEINFLFELFNNWNEDAFFYILEYFSNNNINSILKKLSYLPNNKYLSKGIEILAIETINGNIEFGNISDFENTFQNFKRIYDQRTQIILIPFLLYLYSLDKKLIPIKKTIWKLFNKNHRNLEAYLLMSDIQKSIIRMRKSQEFLIQEGYNLLEKVNYNMDLLILLSDKNYPYHNIFKILKEIEENKEIQDIPEIKEELIIKKATEYFKIKTITPKPITQQLLVFKNTDISDKIVNYFSKTFLSAEENIQYVISELVKDIKINYENAYLIREITFTSIDILKKKGINPQDSIKLLFVYFILCLFENDFNALKILSYTLGYEITLGVFKIKYKPEDAVIAITNAIKLLEQDFFTNLQNKNEIINLIIEYTHSGYWEASIEITPNLQSIEKNSILFFELLKNGI
ncbi:MAG: hypothetical protein U0457_14200 [Candidatus Sericytochromatia bacterium]